MSCWLQLSDSLGLFKYWKELQSKREVFIHWLTSRIATTARPGPGRSQDPGNLPGSPIYMAGTQKLGLLPPRYTCREWYGTRPGTAKQQLERLRPWPVSLEQHSGSGTSRAAAPSGVVLFWAPSCMVHLESQDSLSAPLTLCASHMAPALPPGCSSGPLLISPPDSCWLLLVPVFFQKEPSAYKSCPAL